MKPFETFRGLVAGIDRANIDTDQIIPKQFLKSIKRTWFGESLFFDWRYHPDGLPNQDFELNQPRFKGASILVARNNFGCGSSREHAVWAIAQYGFKCVIAPSGENSGSRIPAFADIFRNNCSQNALLTVELTEREVNQIFQMVHEHPGLEAAVDLEKQQVVFYPKDKVFFHFDIDVAVKERLLKGLDDIGLTLQYEKTIREFELKHNTYCSWK